MGTRRAALTLAAAMAATAGLAAVLPAGDSAPAGETASLYCVGAAKADITPTQAMIATGNFYLGGYGIGPEHPAHGVLRPLYSRAIAIGVPDPAGHCPGPPADQIVVAADDLQGHFLAYQQGPYGFADMDDMLSSSLGISSSHILIQSTHTHNGPDDLGVWGGVPSSYLAEVTTQTESAITQAVRSEQPATLRWATADMTGFSSGDTTAGPVDDTLRILQATSTSSGAVIATMLDYSTHATVYGPLDEVSPDWPGATATYLEGDEIGDPGTGYPGSVAVVTVGAMGETHPSGVPAGDAAPDGPVPATDDNYPADDYGDAVGHMGMAALADPTRAHVLSGPAQVGGVSSTFDVVNDNPVLLGAVALPVPGYHVYRADTPPYGAGDVLVTEAQMLRLGDLALMSAPGEPYPSIEFTMAKEIATPVVFPFGLADDQLGYIEQPGDYPSAMQCSTTDEGFFTISPTFGDQLEAAQRQNAERLGFAVADPGPVADANLGQLPPPTSCTVQQLQQLLEDPTGALP
jgi:hypothetical protein